MLERTAYIGLVALLLVAGISDNFSAGAQTQFVEFQLASTGLETGQPDSPVNFTNADYAGQVVLVDFMAVNCFSCRTVTEKLLKPMAAEFAGEDFRILSINSWTDKVPGEDDAAMRELQESEGTLWRHALDTDQVSTRMGVYAIPAIMVIDGDGQVIFRGDTGASPSELRSAIRAGLSGDAEPVPFYAIGIVGLAFFAGAASFLAPCSVALLPAYLSALLQQKQSTKLQSAWYGAGTAVGMIAAYALVAFLIFQASKTFLVALPWISPTIAVLMVVFGILMLVGTRWDGLAKMLGLQRIDGRRGFLLFGLAYGLAAFACTGPILLPILLQAFSSGPRIGLFAFLAFALALFIGFVGASILVRSGLQGPLRKILAQGQKLQLIGGGLMIAAGAYLLFYDLRALGYL